MWTRERPASDLRPLPDVRTDNKMTLLQSILSIGIGISRPFSWPDASKDRCRVCGVARKYHGNKPHLFEEDV